MSEKEQGIREYTQHGTRFIGFGKVYGEESYNNEPIHVSPDQSEEESGPDFFNFGKGNEEQLFNGKPLDTKE